MGAGGGFGMVLNAENRFFLVAKTFDGLVVEVYSIDNNVGGQRFGVNSETVVLGGDFDFAGFQIFDRLVAAAMTKFEFERFAAKGLRQNLKPKADAEHGDAGFY